MASFNYEPNTQILTIITSHQQFQRCWSDIISRLNLIFSELVRQEDSYLIKFVSGRGALFYYTTNDDGSISIKLTKDWAIHMDEMYDISLVDFGVGATINYITKMHWSGK